MKHTAKDQDQDPRVLYRHAKRPRWGLALLAWDHGDTRGYQFEDGKLRIFKRGFYRLLETVDPPADHSARVLERLNRALGRSEACRERGDHDLPIPLDEQIAHFKEQYPDGFSGADWSGKMRGRDAKRPLKRHRDPAVARARKQLSADVLQRLSDGQRYDEILQALVDVLGATTLVSSARLAPLRSAPQYRRRAIALALRELLHGTGSLAGRFDAFVDSLGEPSWELATAPLALVHPEEHVCVRPSVFGQQALWMAPRLEHTPVPVARIYLRYLEMARAVRDQLAEAGLGPRDLLDVHDFVYATLRPAVRELLAERARGRGARAARPGAKAEPEREAA